MNADLVVSAVPGFMGFECLKNLIDLKKNVVDISFFPEDAFELNQLALDHNVTAVVDCGVAPGLCNIQAGYVQKKMDSVHSYLCYVGGLPRTRTWPFEYKAVFSPIDVIEEYTRPARYVEHGELVVKEALTYLEKMDFPGVGTLEAFNTDGLRSLIYTLQAPFNKEKTLRYICHVELMRTFRESGFFDTNPIQVGQQTVIPLELTSKLLFKQWKLEPGEQDLTVLQVCMTGEENGQQVKYTFDLLDYLMWPRTHTPWQEPRDTRAPSSQGRSFQDFSAERAFAHPNTLGKKKAVTRTSKLSMLSAVLLFRRNAK